MDNTFTPNTDDTTVDGWAYVEIFGHTQLAGRISTKKLGTSVMFQIDVPDGENDFSHSELYPPASIFSIKPTTEDWCRKFSEYRKNQRLSILPYVPEKHRLLTDNIDSSENNDEADLKYFDTLLSPEDDENIIGA
jgi:hypothetical protein